MTRNKYSFSKFVTKNIATGTNRTSTMIDIDSLNNYFANIGKNLASGSIFSNLGNLIISKSTENTIFLYPADANEIYSLIRNCKTTISSGLDGLSNNLLIISGPAISEFSAVIFSRCLQVGYFPKLLKTARIRPLFKKCDTQTPKTTVPSHCYHR